MIKELSKLFKALFALTQFIGGSATAQDLLEITHLYNFSDGSNLSSMVRSISHGGYELEDGRYQSFHEWYTPDFPELKILLFTEANPNFAILWGLSTGERGRKYKIDPAVHIGFSVIGNITPRLSVTLTAIGVLGGNLSESSCYGVYPPFGTYEVNCRLAASELAPEDTLNYMLSSKGWKDSTIAIQFNYVF